MRSRSAYATGVSILTLIVACGGEPFTTEGGGGADSGSGGRAGAGGRPTGSGGSIAKAGSSGKAGNGSGVAGKPSSGGVTGIGGNVALGGVVGVSGTGMTGEAGTQASMSCSDAGDCPTSSSCVKATCVDEQCGEENLPDGPFMLQVPGDCKQARCEGGEEQLVADSTDQDDKNECTKDSCDADGTASHLAQTGQQCANGGTCSPDGRCQVCPGGCPAAAEPCHVSYCAAGVCEVGHAPSDTLCPLPNTPSDQYGQCNEEGVCVDCTTNGACDEASVCSNQTCVSDTD